MTDEGRPSTDGAPGGPGDSRSPVGSVAEEAARLVELLAASGTWGQGARATQGEPRPRPEGDGTKESAGRTEGHSCTCGGATPQACRLCPVCQVIAFVGSISPETIERAADLVGLAATALHDLASAQRSRQAAGSGAPPAQDPTP